ILAGDGDAHHKNAAQQHAVRRLRSRPVDCGDLDAEVVDHRLLRRTGALVELGLGSYVGRCHLEACPKVYDCKMRFALGGLTLNYKGVSPKNECNNIERLCFRGEWSKFARLRLLRKIAPFCGTCRSADLSIGPAGRRAARRGASVG